MVLVSNVAFGAAALGCAHMEIKNRGEWWFAASESNWLKSDSSRFRCTEDLFGRVIDFPELGPSSIRPEIYVAAFAKHLYVDLSGVYTHLLGTPLAPPLPHVGVVPVWCRYVLAFQLEIERY